MLNIFLLILLGSLILWSLSERHGRPFELLAFASRNLTKRQRWCYFGLSLLIFFSGWHLLALLSSGGVSRVPFPLDVSTALLRLLLSGTLISEVFVSCIRILVGFTVASLVGVLIGLLAGSFVIFNQTIRPISSFLRYIPPTAFVSLLIIYFGIGEMYKYAVIFFGILFFIIQMVVDVVEDIDRKYLELVLTSGCSELRAFKEVILPASMPRIFDVLRINLSAAWTFLVIAEIIGADSGMGHLVAVSQRFLRIDELYAAIFSFGVIGVLTDVCLERLSRHLFRWHFLSAG